ncbi:unnamed protein product, partial [Heterotrigona itama]
NLKTNVTKRIAINTRVCFTKTDILSRLKYDELYYINTSETRGSSPHRYT